MIDIIGKAIARFRGRFAKKPAGEKPEAKLPPKRGRKRKRRR